LANVGKAVAEGTPIADAFRQNGMTIAPPGAAVPNPMDPSRLTFGSIGQFTDHQVFAFSKDLVLINGQIHPISDVAGPGFLGWMPPPDLPAAPLAPPTTSAPTPAAAPAHGLTPNTPNTGTGTTLLTPVGLR
jgi:hypothetical protein